MGKILIVDDDEDIAFVIADILKHHGHEYHTASNGKECLRLIKKKAFDLILLDVLMQGMEGPELAKLIKQELEDQKILYLSVLDSQEIDMTHADGYLQKPFDIEVFLGVVQKHL